MNIMGIYSNLKAKSAVVATSILISIIPACGQEIESVADSFECELESSKEIHKWSVGPSLLYFSHDGTPQHAILETPDIQSIISMVERATGLNIKTNLVPLSQNYNIFIVEHCSSSIDGKPDSKADGCINHWEMGYCPEPYSNFQKVKSAYTSEELAKKKCIRRGHRVHFYSDHSVMVRLSNPVLNTKPLSEYVLKGKPYRHPKSFVDRRRRTKASGVEGRFWLGDNNDILNTYCLIKYNLSLAKKKRLITECLVRSFGMYEFSSDENSEGIFLQETPPISDKTVGFSMPSKGVVSCLEELYQADE